MPVNFLLYTALMRLGAYYGDNFKIECPTGSGNVMNLFEVAQVLGERLISTFTKDSSGRSDRCLAMRRSFRRIRTGVTTFSSTSTSMAIRVPASGRVIRRDGRDVLRGSFKRTVLLRRRMLTSATSSGSRSGLDRDRVKRQWLRMWRSRSSFVLRQEG